MTQKNYFVLTGASIYTEQKVLNDYSLVIKDNHIEAIVPNDQIKKFSSAKILGFPKDFHIVPGFIDMHIHGANNKDVMDASFAALATISQTLAAEGTTSYLATTMTATPKEIENVLCHVRDYIERPKEIVGAEVLGVHLEGPFLSANKMGAQRSDLLIPPNIEYVERWQSVSNNAIKLITLAPELPNSLEFIRYLARNNILAGIGHTDATHAETCDAISAGCHYATHLFNAMRHLHQREPGAVGAILLADEVSAELIVDGVHLHPAIVQLVLKLKGKDKLVLVTDAMRAKCLPDGFYDLGGQRVEVKDAIAKLANGTLAGSTLKMIDAVKNMLQFSGCGLLDVIKMTSVNPAKLLGVFDKKGSLATNKDADIVILNNKHDVVMTWCQGRIITS